MRLFQGNLALRQIQFPCHEFVPDRLELRLSLEPLANRRFRGLGRSDSEGSKYLSHLALGAEEPLRLWIVREGTGDKL